MMLLKKTVYDKLVAKLNNIDTNIFVLKSKYETDKSELENKIPPVSNLVKKHIIILKLLKLKKSLLTIIMTNILILKSLIN